MERGLLASQVRRMMKTKENGGLGNRTFWLEERSDVTSGVA